MPGKLHRAETGASFDFERMQGRDGYPRYNKAARLVGRVLRNDETGDNTRLLIAI